MATYKVRYFIKRGEKEFPASQICEASNEKEAIIAARDYAKYWHLPFPFRPTAKLMTDYELSSVDWKMDIIAGAFKRRNTEELLFPDKMTPSRLAEACTYCSTIHNPYAEELMRRAGNLGSFQSSNDEAERGRILRNAAKSFGIVLC